MRIQYISSACTLIEAEGIRILCDPWLTEGIYYGSWYHYPLPALTAKDFQDVDYIYISHIHPDHCDVESLKQFPSTIPVMIHDYQEKFLFNLLKRVGFQRIIEVLHREPYYFSDTFKVEILAADNCDPTKCGRWFGCHLQEAPTKSTQIDSMAVFSGNGQVVVNTNDCPFELAKEVCQYVTAKYSPIDFLLVGYSGAGPYPQCMLNYTDEEKLVRAAAKKQSFLTQAIHYIETLQPKYFLPFAGQYTLGGHLSKLNPFRGVPELEELPQIFTNLLKESQSNSQLVLLNSGEWFDLTTQKATARFDPPNPQKRKQFVEQELVNKQLSYEKDAAFPPFEELAKKMENAYQHLLIKQKQFGFFSPTSACIDIGQQKLFQIPYDKSGFKVIDRSEMKEPFVHIKLDPRLLNMILDRKAHWNNAEIGSHLGFDRRPDIYERGIYNFLSYLHCTYTERDSKLGF
jgi:UDP-MurNAc hydroxylase